MVETGQKELPFLTELALLLVIVFPSVTGDDIMVASLLRVYYTNCNMISSGAVPLVRAPWDKILNRVPLWQLFG